MQKQKLKLGMQYMDSGVKDPHKQVHIQFIRCSFYKASFRNSLDVEESWIGMCCNVLITQIL